MTEAYSHDLHPPLPLVREIVARALQEDLAPLGDITTTLVPSGHQATANIVAHPEGVLAGRLTADEAFRQVDSNVTVDWLVDDGGEIGPDETIARVTGSLASILSAERTALNFLCHLSGIASLTRRYSRAARGVRVRDTRKTTPGLRALEKAAVRAGGGINHRGSLSDGIVIKDNHLTAMSMADAVRRANLRWPGRCIEVECDTFEQVQDALESKADMVMLDNMSPEEVQKCVAEIAGRCTVEVSGNITLQTISAYAGAGADFISVGALTHSAPAFDIGIDFQS